MGGGQNRYHASISAFGFAAPPEYFAVGELLRLRAGAFT